MDEEILIWYILPNVPQCLWLRKLLSKEELNYLGLKYFIIHSKRGTTFRRFLIC